jgi:hypothetical protein
MFFKRRVRSMVGEHQLGAKVCFQAPAGIVQQVQAWEQEIDERIFFEQLRTGRLVYDEYEIHPDSYSLMKKRYKKHGRIEPYYGCSGSSISYQFHILPATGHVELTVQHGATRETISFASLPFAECLDQPAARCFQITGKEMETLAQWEEWDAEAGLSGKYMFQFFFSGIVNGCVVKNTETGNEVNLTDYDDW